jgi:hypothetical protein
MIQLLFVLTSLRLLPAPRQMSEKPTFPELVVYLLPEKEWIYLVPPQHTPANTRRGNTRNATRPPRLDNHHYQLLSTHPDCDRSLLELAYKDWLKLEEYEDGKKYGESLLNDIAPFGVAKNLFREIMNGLAGSDVDQVRFKEKWIQKGLTEAGRSKEWTTFQVVQKGIFDVKLLESLLDDTSYKIQWKSPMLGRILRSSRKRRKH